MKVHAAKVRAIQGDLFPSLAPDFDGETYERSLDHAPLHRQLEIVRSFMADGRWHTLPAIAKATGVRAEASISARLRDLRKPKFGGYTVERRRAEHRLFEYRLVAGE